MSPLLNAADEAEWFGTVARLADKWGFDRLLVAMLPRPTIRLEDAFIRSTYAPAWRRSYDEQGLMHIDPTVAHATARSSPLIWSAEIFTTPAQQRITPLVKRCVDRTDHAGGKRVERLRPFEFDETDAVGYVSRDFVADGG